MVLVGMTRMREVIESRTITCIRDRGSSPTSASPRLSIVAITFSHHSFKSGFDCMIMAESLSIPPIHYYVNLLSVNGMCKLGMGTVTV
jgi:hypothetical protein